MQILPTIFIEPIYRIIIVIIAALAVAFLSYKKVKVDIRQACHLAMVSSCMLMVCWYAAYSWYALIDDTIAMLSLGLLCTTMTIVAYTLNCEELAWLSLLALFLLPRTPVTFRGAINSQIIPFSSELLLATAIISLSISSFFSLKRGWISATIAAALYGWYRLYHYIDAVTDSYFTWIMLILYACMTIALPLLFPKRALKWRLITIAIGCIATAYISHLIISIHYDDAHTTQNVQ